MATNFVSLHLLAMWWLQIDPTGDLQFIDFEYSVPGYRGFDWGNHFNEYAGTLSA
jgi:thiamine kinase-like enzyme